MTEPLEQQRYEEAASIVVKEIDRTFVFGYN